MVWIRDLDQVTKPNEARRDLWPERVTPPMFDPWYEPRNVRNLRLPVHRGRIL